MRALAVLQWIALAEDIAARLAALSAPGLCVGVIAAGASTPAEVDRRLAEGIGEPWGEHDD